MSSVPPSHPSTESTPSEANHTTQISTTDLTQPTKRSWVWLYFSDVDDNHVQCQVNNPAGKCCNQKLKCNQTGSTKSMSQHLNLLHCLTSINHHHGVQRSQATLDDFLKNCNLKRYVSTFSSYT
ncbi:hypothetical protein O181_019234 [Austropuccinia psidii MF-1]|uniref:BED-type domain-containing protein n=1 Tax=Austropuccinia psidii MF-1 TaxID=1389203 RepID=A0A9Q3C6P3_9BASI|nr:hypothetical protein [Austropuccinia psidii MF-1]